MYRRLRHFITEFTLSGKLNQKTESELRTAFDSRPSLIVDFMKLFFTSNRILHHLHSDGNKRSAVAPESWPQTDGEVTSREQDNFTWTTGDDLGISHLRMIDYGAVSEVHQVRP